MVYLLVFNNIQRTANSFVKLKRQLVKIIHLLEIV